MGYRSDVGLGIVFENDEKLLEFALKVVAVQPITVREALLEYSRSTGGDGFIFAGFEDVKWYDSYPDVDSHTALFDQARAWVDQTLEQQTHCSIGAIFTRIGESTDDVEEIAVGDYEWEWIQVHRSLEIDW
jgi:hypothetical protein